MTFRKRNMPKSIAATICETGENSRRNNNNKKPAINHDGKRNIKYACVIFLSGLTKFEYENLQYNNECAR